MRLYLDHCWTEPINGNRLEKQENDLSEVRYHFQGPRASTLQSKMTTYSFERVFNLEKKEETSTIMLVITDCITKHTHFHNGLTKVIIINTSMLTLISLCRWKSPQSSSKIRYRKSSN